MRTAAPPMSMSVRYHCQPSLQIFIFVTIRQTLCVTRLDHVEMLSVLPPSSLTFRFALPLHLLVVFLLLTLESVFSFLMLPRHHGERRSRYRGAQARFSKMHGLVTFGFAELEDLVGSKGRGG